MKLVELDPLEISASGVAAPAAVGIAAPATEAEDMTPERMLNDLFPVASAIIDPPGLKPNMLSMRSGTVMKAKEPALAMIRGTAMTMSFGKYSVRKVTLELEAMTAGRL